jgi:hypothetical protein
MTYVDGAIHYAHPPTVGALVVHDHTVWRVVEVNPIPADRWTDHDRQSLRVLKPAYHNTATPAVVVLRPAGITGDDPRDRDRDKHYRHYWGRTWYVYPDEHYPVCRTCGEPVPCRERLNQRVAERALAEMGKYETPGVCPACGDLVTTRQKAVTYPGNLEIPGGPDVTFHAGRRECRWTAGCYEKRWLAADPDRRRPLLTTPDGT